MTRSELGAPPQNLAANRLASRPESVRFGADNNGGNDWWSQAGSLLSSVLSDPKAAFQRNVENRLLYQPTVNGMIPRAASLATLTNPALRAQVQEVTFNAADGVQLSAWYIPPKPGKETVLISHGNGGNISHREHIYQPLVNAGYGVLAYDYRGYGNSQGESNEPGLYLDHQAAVNFLKNQKQTDPATQVILMGESLGGAVAIDAASKQKFRMLVTVSTFTSLPNVAATLFKNAPVLGDLSSKVLPTLVSQQFNSLDKMKNLQCPVLIVHGDQDTLVPFEMSDKLYDAVTNQYADHLTAEGCDHNNVFLGIPGDILRQMELLLQKSAPPTPPDATS
jgi:fermentation-respiration switch protein FrsA (DUF1100 family)